MVAATPLHQLRRVRVPRLLSACSQAFSALSPPSAPPSLVVRSPECASRPRPLARSAAPAPPPSPRCFSTSPPRHTKTIKPHRLPANLIPPYPYGQRRVYKQSNRGLYGSARIRFGNTVAEKHRNKSRRVWRPNVHVKTFFSPALGARVKTRLTLRVLKTIRREGGIENYLLKSKPARVKELGPGGWNLRWILMQTRLVQERFNRERIALGLEPNEIEDRDDVIQFALDYATPGPLSVRSRATLDDMRASVADAFVLGEETLADVEGVQELSDEAEERLLRDMGDADEHHQHHHHHHHRHALDSQPRPEA